MRDAANRMASAQNREGGPTGAVLTPQTWSYNTVSLVDSETQQVENWPVQSIGRGYCESDSSIPPATARQAGCCRAPQGG